MAPKNKRFIQERFKMVANGEPSDLLMSRDPKEHEQTPQLRAILRRRIRGYSPQNSQNVKSKQP